MPSQPRHRACSARRHACLRRVEQQVRWSQEKAESLPSSQLWRFLPQDKLPAISRLMIVRVTRANTGAVVRQLPGVFSAAFPADPQRALGALRGDGRWPGPALLWARIDRDRVTLLAQ